MKKNNTAEKTVLDAERIAKALKEGTEKSLKNIINEAISSVINESADEEDVDENDFEVEDVEKSEPQDKTDEVADTAEESSEEEVEDKDEPKEETEEVPAEEESEEETEDKEDDEWSDFEDYKIGDNEYDFTGVNGDEILKIYNKLGDDDQIFVKKTDEGEYEVKDEETGAEFVIELNPDAIEDSESEEEKSEDAEEDELEVSVEGDEPAEDEIEIELDTEEDEPKDEEETEEEKEESIDECNANECNTNECEKPLEEGDTISTQTVRKAVKSKMGQHRPNAPEYAVRKVDSPLSENIKKIVKAAKAIQEENKQYKSCINEIKKSLYEAAVLNVNLGKLVDLLVNETTTKDEKKAICKRFNNAKTLKEGEELYSAIKSELNEAKSSAPVIEKQFKATSTKSLNETTIYSNEKNNVIDLMDRMDNLYKKN